MRIIPFLACLAACCGVSAAMPAPASAQEELQDGPKSLVISYRASAEHRTAFRAYLLADLAPRLRAMKGRGELADFRIFYSWYRQPQVWDAMVILRFPTYAAVGRWTRLEQTQPGGLDAKGMRLADPVTTYAADLAWSRNPDDLRKGEVYYIIPYEYRNEAEYRAYVAGYVLPQFDGWIRTGALTGYELFMNRYQSGAPWDSLFIQHYRDMASFGRRQKITASVRAQLASDPQWKAWSDKKAGIRTETEDSIAELLAH